MRTIKEERVDMVLVKDKEFSDIQFYTTPREAKKYQVVDPKVVSVPRSLVLNEETGLTHFE